MVQQTEKSPRSISESQELKARADQLFFRNALRVKDADADSARAKLEEALNIYESLGDLRGQSNCLTFLGLFDMERGFPERAVEKFQASLRVVEQIEDLFAAWWLHLILARAEGQVPRADLARFEFERAFESLLKLERSESDVNLESFRVFSQLYDLPPQFLDLLQELGGDLMKRIMKVLIVRLAEIMTRVSWGESLLAWRQYETAEEQFAQALKTSRRSLFGLADHLVLSRLGKLDLKRFRLDEAREHLQEALSEAPALIGKENPKVEILELLSEAELLAGRFDAAISANSKAVELVRRLGDHRKESLLLSEQARMQFWGNRRQEAKLTLQAALEIARKTNDPYPEAVALVQLGGIAQFTAAYEEAATYLTGAVRRFRDANDPYGSVNALLQLGQVRELLGEPDGLSKNLSAALVLAQKAGFTEAEALVGLTIALDGFMKGSSGTVSADLSVLSEALTSSDSGMLQQLGNSLGPTLGLFLESLSQTQAKAVVDPISARLKVEKSPYLRALLLVGLATIEHRRGRHRQAEPLWEEAHQLFAEVGQSDLKSLALFALGATQWRLGERDQALSSCTRAVEDLDREVAGGIRVDDLLTSFLGGDRRWLYASLVEMLAQAGHTEQAFFQAEKARARALLQMLENQRFNPSVGAAGELIVQADVLRAKIRQWEQTVDRNRTGPNEMDLALARDRYRDLLVEIKLSNPEYASVVSADPRNAAEIRRLVLGQQTTLVSYFIGPTRVLAWVLDRGRIEQVVLPVAPEELEAAVARTVGSLQICRGKTRGARPLQADCEDDELLGGALYRQLVAPLKPFLAGPNLIVAPHGVLHFLPFAALRSPEGRYLIEEFTLSYSPSASILPHLGDKQNAFEGKALVIGNPASGLVSLPQAEEEAGTVARLFSVRPLLGPDATETEIRRRAGGVDLLHIAAHGVYNPRNPRFSRIAVTPDDHHDGNLEVHEIFGELDLGEVNLVVLSACQTAIGERTGGDDVIGMTRAFLYAGSPAVIATLWRIDDAATAQLMEDFYANLLQGLPIAEALRSAQIKMLRSGASPYYWAAFSLTGDPRNGLGGHAH